ncbi:MAG: hypothetical protein CMA84_06735 [Euryarchaeota archaeon]|nr:hypothetical protein [Euryarchaeota archaeon]
MWERAIEFDCVGTEKVITLGVLAMSKGMVSGYLGSLTTEERTLLHLVEEPLPKNKWEAQDAVTQAGISAAVYVQRKHVPRTLKRLEKNNYINTSLRHVPSSKQRRRVYELTPDGREAAALLRKKILDTTIEIEGDSNTISGLLSSGESLLKLLAHFDENLLYHTTPVVAPVSSADGSASLDAQAGENLVRQMFATAWKDGKITKDEQQLLSDVVSFLGMHPDRARRLSEEAMGVPTTPPPEEVYLDMLRQALMDGELAEDEMVLIKTFQTAFEIDEETHTKLLEVAKSEPALPPHLETYKATLATAMEDGIITKDEDSMLQTLRKSLNVSESEHATLLANLMDQ